jgi:midasin
MLIFWFSNQGFCTPKDLMDDDDEKGKQEGDQNAQGFGFEEGEGEKDVSDK